MIPEDKQPDSWIEEFDKEFGWLVDDKKGGWSLAEKDLKSFISHLLLSREEELVKAVSELKILKENTVGGTQADADSNAVNQTLSRVIEIIKQRKA